MLDGDDMRARFDRAYAERRKAGYRIPVGRGVWVSLYRPEGNDPVTHVGAGAGREKPPIARVPLDDMVPALVALAHHVEADEDEEAPLTIAEAKRRLALNFGFDPANVKITIEA